MVKYKLSPRQKQLHNTANVTLAFCKNLYWQHAYTKHRTQSGVKAECMPTPAQTLNFKIR